jgi:imidazolonepropionase
MTKQLFTGLTEIYTCLGQAAAHEPKIHSIQDGAILVEDGKILAVDSAASLMGNQADVKLVDMGGRVAIPGFIDPHTHLVWGGERSHEFNRRLHGASYVDIAAEGGGIKYTVQQTRDASIDTLEAKARQTLDTMLLHGVTSIEAKSGYGLNLETELKQLDVMDRLSASHKIELTQTFMGAHEVPPEFKGRPREYVELLNSEMLPEVHRRGTVKYVDIFCEKGVFELEDTRLHMQAAADMGFGLRFHADELAPLGGAGLAADLGAISADHLIHASEADMRKMADAGTIATLLPGTSFFLRMDYADAQRFKDAGCLISLSTDYNPGSSHTINQALMMALACMNMSLTFEEAFQAVTLNAAAAIDRASEIGTLEPGKQADIVFLDVPSALNLVYYWGVNHVSDVVKQGNFAVRNRHLVL